MSSNKIVSQHFANAFARRRSMSGEPLIDYRAEVLYPAGFRPPLGEGAPKLLSILRRLVLSTLEFVVHRKSYWLPVALLSFCLQFLRNLLLTLMLHYNPGNNTYHGGGTRQQKGESNLE